MEFVDSLMEETLKLARENVSNGGWPFACIIAKDNKAIAKAVNQVHESKDPSQHAEIVAIREACQTLDTVDLSGCTMYVVGIPCPMCLSCSILAKLNKIVYAVDVKEKDEALTKLPSTDSLYGLIKQNYGENFVQYKHMKNFSEKGVEVFEMWNNQS